MFYRLSLFFYGHGRYWRGGNDLFALYWESYDEVHKALAREKQLKGWARAKKIALLERRNPQWKDLAAEWDPCMETGEGRDPSTTQ